MPIHTLILEDTWFIGYNDDKTVIHYCYCEPDTQLDSGQEFIELFDNEEDYLIRLSELNINIE
jgi:hypothetical protein